MSTVYVGNLDSSATGFCFVEFDDERDARDAVRDMDGRTILDKKVRVEISKRGRGGREKRDSNGPTVRGPKIRTEHRIRITGLASDCNWHALKSFICREMGSSGEPVFVDMSGRGEAIAEFNSNNDMEDAVDKLHDLKYDGGYITVKRDGRGRSRSRSRSRDNKKRDSSRGRDRSRS